MRTLTRSSLADWERIGISDILKLSRRSGDNCEPNAGQVDVALIYCGR